MPLISIIIITYNREKFIKYAIDSVLTQKYKNFEIIIIDNGSTDRTEDIMQEYLRLGLSIKYIKNIENLNIPQSRNLALSLCNGKYIAVLDSDDVWFDKEKLEKQINFLEKNNDFALIGTNAIFIDEFGKEIKKSNVKLSNKNIRKNILLRNQFFHSSVVFNKEVVLQLKYDEDLKIGEDYDLFLRIGKKYKFANLKDYCVLYRVHNSSICTTDRISAAKYTQNIIKEYSKYYPNFLFAFIKSYLRIFLAYLYSFMNKKYE